MSVLVVVLVAVLAIVGGRYFYERTPKRRQKRQIRALMEVCDGDQALVERLIFAEMDRDPALGFGQAAERARRRLSRDRA